MYVDENEIIIVSGEGTDVGHVRAYDGEKSTKALTEALNEERCNDDRWAYAIQRCSLLDDYGYNLDTGMRTDWLEVDNV
jgi:hypothetical protein